MKKNKIKIFDILKILKLKNKGKKNFFINKISDISRAKAGDLTICKNSKYVNFLKSSKASAIIIEKKYAKLVPKKTFAIISKNPELDFLSIANILYKDVVLDFICSKKLSDKQIKKKYKKIFYGNNFNCEKNVKIGLNTKIGYNVTIKQDSVIGKNVNIGSNVLISNAIIEDNVNIGDGTIIGKKGFGFKFFKNEVLRVPHIGKVIIKKNSEIGSNCNIDRGSISDTIIGKYTFLDNQIQIAHNVKIGDYCMIASQVGISGSTKIGNKVQIGGQAGISGHLVIGNNVKIGGKSGVVKNIQDNKTVMGYPAVEFREFVKKNIIK